MLTVFSQDTVMKLVKNNTKLTLSFLLLSPTKSSHVNSRENRAFPSHMLHCKNPVQCIFQLIYTHQVLSV